MNSCFILLEGSEAARGIDANTDKTEFVCFKQYVTISILNGKPLILIDQLTYIISNISSTKSNVYICIRKVCITTVKLYDKDLFLTIEWLTICDKFTVTLAISERKREKWALTIRCWRLLPPFAPLVTPKTSVSPQIPACEAVKR